MGNSMAKKRKMASPPSKKLRLESHVVSLTSSSLNHLTVEFPKEIEEDLERRRIESFKVLAAGSRKPTRTTSDSAVSSDPAHELYEKMRKLDVPAMMVPKPWSEVDQILSKHKLYFNNNEGALTPKRTPAPSPSPRKPPASKPLEEAQPETIDMWELMDDLDEGDQDDDQTSRKKALNHMHSSPGSFKPEKYSPEKIRPLETSLSFSTIHTLKELEGGAAKPETVTNIMKSYCDSPGRSPGAARRMNTSVAIATTTPWKVNVNPRLLARVQTFS